MVPSAYSRVLMLVENCSYPRDYRVSSEASALHAAGYSVSVICPSEKGQPWREIIRGITVYRYPPPLAVQSYLGYCWEYTYSLFATFLLSLFVWLNSGFDIIHAANPPDTTFLIAAFYKLFGKCFIYDHHDLAPELYYAHFEGRGNPFIYRLLIWLEKFSCRIADHVIATNQSYKTLEMERGYVPEERITVVRNGPDLNRLQPSEPIAGLKQNDKSLIAYVGMIEYQDGVDYLLRALWHLVNDLNRTDFTCIVAGDGGALPTIKRLCEELGLSDYVFFTGWLEAPQLARYLSSADIGVAPEPSNELNIRSTMIKIMDYMALGKPVVAFDLPEHRITAGDAAVYAHANDELDLARQIASLMDDPQRRIEMGRIGRMRIKNSLAWSHQKKHLLEAYKVVKNKFLNEHDASHGLLN